MDIEKGRGGFKALAKGYDRHPHRFIGKVNFLGSIGPKKVLKLPFLFGGSAWRPRKSI